MPTNIGKRLLTIPDSINNTMAGFVSPIQAILGGQTTFIMSNKLMTLYVCASKTTLMYNINQKFVLYVTKM